MNSYFLLLAVLIPFIGGAILFGAKHWSYNKIKIYSEVLTIVTSILVLLLLLNRPEERCVLFHLVGNLSILLKLDGLGCVFAGLIAVLWPLANLYTFDYIKNDGEKRTTFLGFYVMTYGVTLGVAFAGNIMTMYFFYEMLTLVTFYLVMYPMTKKAIYASRQYLYYSLGGAAFGFFSIICLVMFGDPNSFVLGGVLDMNLVAEHSNLVLFMFVIAFCGFGVKAALFPFHGWLPSASVAPTPVTALLHAVAVVKSGGFAIIRIIYYAYGADFLRGTWAQYVVMAIAMITILYGSTMAVKEIHIKRRLAYSTVSNLSYILLGATIMTPLGMVGAIVHLIMHAFMKICGFFCIGAIIKQSGKKYMDEIEGMGRKMPVVFACLTVVAIALSGIPPFAGFISKWNLASAGILSGDVMGFVAVGVLLYSSLLTVIYMGQYIVRAWFPRKEVMEKCVSDGAWNQIYDPNWYMTVPLIAFAVAIVLLGLFSNDLVAWIQGIAGVVR